MDDYVKTLDKEAHARYIGKLHFIGGVDPYKLPQKEWSEDPNHLPTITYPDLVNYLVFHPSPFCQLTDFQNYKSMEAYDRFVSGWVRSVTVHTVADNQRTVVKAHVLHSQKLTQPYLVPWIITDKNSSVLCAHCNCVAGLGECCSHVASLLFYIEATVRLREVSTVTQKPAYWMLPTAKSTVSYAPLSDIDFTSSKTLKKKLDKKIESALNGGSQEAEQETKIKKEIQLPQSRYDLFFKSILSEKPSCLSVTEAFSASYIPSSLQPNFPTILSELYDENCKDMEYDDLLKHCHRVFQTISISEEEAKNVEAATKDQASSKMWHRFRTGRITASRMKAACHTSVKNPSISLLKQICYPTEYKFRSEAIEWGCAHEEAARKKYLETAESAHSKLRVQQSGLILNTQYPYLGASPDGLVECDCCGKGCLEVKCPFCMRDENVRAGKSSCLEETNDGLRLKRNHPYFYQVQTQLYVSDTDYCDFIMWTQKDLFVERIEPDPDMWSEIVDMSSNFFATVVLPELVGKYFSLTESSKTQTVRSLQEASTVISANICPTASTSHNCLRPSKPAPKKTCRKKKTKQTEEETPLYCVCHGPESGRMIQCESSDCPYKPYEWFHFSCVKLKKEPNGHWYCPECVEAQFLKNLKDSKR